MKAIEITRHYSMTLDHEEMKELILGFRAYVREYTVPEMAESMLAAMEDAYTGELPTPPGEPINGDELQPG